MCSEAEKASRASPKTSQYEIYIMSLMLNISPATPCHDGFLLKSFLLHLRWNKSLQVILARASRFAKLSKPEGISWRHKRQA